MKRESKRSSGEKQNGRNINLDAATVETSRGEQFWELPSFGPY